MNRQYLQPRRARRVAPFGPSFGPSFGDLQTQFDRMLDDVWRGFEPVASEAVDRPQVPQVDVAEKDGGYEIAAELPGIAESDLEVDVREDVLTIKGEKKHEAEKEKGDMHVSERSYGRFQRSFRLPPEADVENIAASFENGVLHVRVPKHAEVEPPVRKIAISKA